MCCLVIGLLANQFPIDWPKEMAMVVTEFFVRQVVLPGISRDVFRHLVFHHFHLLSLWNHFSACLASFLQDQEKRK